MRKNKKTSHRFDSVFDQITNTIIWYSVAEILCKTPQERLKVDKFAKVVTFLIQFTELSHIC